MMFVHAFLISWKREVTDEQISRYKSELFALRKEIPGFVDACFGRKVDSGGGKFTHGGAVLFESLDSLRAAETHPGHEALGAFVMPLISEFQTFDLQVSSASTEGSGS